MLTVDEYRHSWQGKVLRDQLKMGMFGIVKPRGKLGSVLLSVFAHGLDAGPLAIILAVNFPGYYSIGTPFLCSAAKIDKRGRIVADAVLHDDEPPTKDHVLFRCLKDMEGSFRRLADHLKLDDTERLKLFTAAKEWVVADRRFDPAMDPADPDARRLVLH